MIYLDHSTAPPIDPRVIHAMEPCLRDLHSSPASLHQKGREARLALDEARSQVASLIGVSSEEIIFTASGTEADNLAIKGLAQAQSRQGRHLVVSNIEHHAVGYAARALERQGFSVAEVPADPDGLVDPAKVEWAIRDDTVLVSVMLVNDETGALQSVSEITRIAHKHGALMHTDAVSAMGSMSVDAQAIGVDALSMSARSLNGPPGIGALYVKKGTRIRPQVEGGVQEEGRRGGHENIPAIVGFGRAASLAKAELPGRIARLKRLDSTFLKGLKDRIPDAALNGHPRLRIPGHLNLWIPEVDGESLVLTLDDRQVAVSMGSSCTAHIDKPSHVLLALGRSPREARCSILVSMGPGTRECEVRDGLDVLAESVEKLRIVTGTRNRTRTDIRS